MCGLERVRAGADVGAVLGGDGILAALEHELSRPAAPRSRGPGSPVHRGRSSRSRSAVVLAVAAISWFELAWLAAHGRIVITVPLRSWLDRVAEHLVSVPIDPVIAAAVCMMRCTWRCMVRTNIDLDPELVAEAFGYSDVKTKKDLVHLALREFIEHRRRHDLRELRGQVRFVEDYDHKELRGDQS